jgi:hypothetical protein
MVTPYCNLFHRLPLPLVLVQTGSVRGKPGDAYQWAGDGKRGEMRLSPRCRLLFPRFKWAMVWKLRDLLVRSLRPGTGHGHGMAGHGGDLDDGLGGRWLGSHPV